MNKVDLLKEQFKILKEQSGSHSPSISTLLEKIPSLNIEIDACFLSNPYATELFMNRFFEQVSKKESFRKLIEYYPAQNKQLASILEKSIEIPHEHIFVCNGAIEGIQAIMHNYFENKTVVILPTFSAYYEYIKDEKNIVFYQLKKENNFELDVIDYIQFVKADKNIENIVLINPNNPTGTFLNKEKMSLLCSELSHLKNILIDESFIHFASQISSEKQSGHVDFYNQFKNISIVKSMSKDFGVAGLRLGYAIMNPLRVKELITHGFLWNISGLGEAFIRLFSKESFLKEYQLCREKYNSDKEKFIEKLLSIQGIKVYPSEANFVLIELLNKKAADFCMEMLANHHIYLRDCSDKIGIQDSEYIRLAIRSEEENNLIFESIKNSI